MPGGARLASFRAGIHGPAVHFNPPKKHAMPTIDSSATSTHECPLCHAALDPSNLTECPKCDWHIGYQPAPQHVGGTRDLAAVILSVLPGLGHIYKGHVLTGALYLLGAVFAVCIAIVASTATAGFGVLLLPLYWAGVMLQVYWLEDIATPPGSRDSAAFPGIRASRD